ncbi:hypothetical protein BJX66DRAFT_344283 [Aspergillus keveii]|uniref:Uncharacterized protein n=1 Tax=Aspergillus keveii TaxID=714993 RepID=A0ABR4FLS5_9EURO
MYFKVKARNAEGSDDESEWEDQSGDGHNGGDEGEKPAEAETATDAAANKPKRGLIEYELTDGEISDPVNLRKDSDIALFNSSTLPPKKQKQQRPKSIPATTASRDIKVDSQSRPLTPTAGPWFPTEYPELPGTLALAKRRTQLSLGEHLKQRQLQKAALHNKLEENIKELQARSDTAREDSEHAAALYTKLQRLGGLLNLSASEADALMDVVLCDLENVTL